MALVAREVLVVLVEAVLIQDGLEDVVTLREPLAELIGVGEGGYGGRAEEESETPHDARRTRYSMTGSVAEEREEKN